MSHRPAPTLKNGTCVNAKILPGSRQVASSLTVILNFLVTDILALAPGLLTASEVNNSYFSLPLAPHWSFFSESGSVVPILFCKLVAARPRSLGNHKGSSESDGTIE